MTADSDFKVRDVSSSMVRVTPSQGENDERDKERRRRKKSIEARPVDADEAAEVLVDEQKLDDAPEPAQTDDQTNDAPEHLVDYLA